MRGVPRVQQTGAAAILCVLCTGPVFAGRQTLECNGQVPAGRGGTIVVQVVNYAEVALADLAKAEQAAACIYEAIGVRVIWVHSEVPLQDPRGLRVRLSLLSHQMAERKIWKERIKGDVLGQANRESYNVYIFFNRIAAVAERNTQDYVRVLGLVIAHEVGHVMLPPPGHSSAGIMSATTNFASKTVKRFTPEQAANIRSVLAAAR